MSVKENDYRISQLLGKTMFPRNTSPTLRAKVRRNDPTGLVSAPFYAGLAGKKLSLEFTRESGGNVIVDNGTVTFSSDQYASAIAQINALSPLNIRAFDADGFLTIQDLNAGKTHFIRAKPQAVPSEEGADILGFIVDPYPGSVSYAGEVSSAPGIRTQGNPQGTALLGDGEDLTAMAVNRGFVSVLGFVARATQDLQREVVAFKKVAVTAYTHPISSVRVFAIDDPTLRIPLRAFGITTPAAPAYGLDPQVELVNDNGEALFLADGNKVRVLDVFYGTNATGLSTATPFSTWGSPDGKSIFGSAVWQKTKTAEFDITVMENDIITCSGADFSDKFVQPGDPVRISVATNNTPWNNNGWWVVEKVWDNERISLRPLADNEDIPFSPPSERPRALNTSGSSSGYGKLRVYVGFFLPAKNLIFQINDTAVVGTQVKLAVGVKLKDLLPQDQALDRYGSSAVLGRRIYDHITDPTDAHAATAIGGFTSSTSWHDGSNTVGANIRLVVEDLTRRLADDTTDVGVNGADLIGVGARTTWRGGRTNPPASVFDGIDKIIVDLSANTVGDDGAERIGAAVAGDLVAGSLRDQLNQLRDEWGRLDRDQAWTGTNDFNGPGGLDPAFRTTTVPTDRGFLWEIQSKAAGEKVRLYVSDGDLGNTLEITYNALWSGSLWIPDNSSVRCMRLQIGQDGLLLEFVDTPGASFAEAVWSGRRLLNFEDVSQFANLYYTLNVVARAVIGSSLEGVLTPQLTLNPQQQTNDRGLLVQSVDPNGSPLFGFWIYTSRTAGADNGAVEIAYNAKWTGSLWEAQWTGASYVLRFSNSKFVLGKRASTALDTWGEAGWAYLEVDPTPPANYYSIPPTAVPRVNPKNTVLCHGRIVTDGAGGISFINGFNLSSTVSLAGGAISISFATTAPSANYAVLLGVGRSSAGQTSVDGASNSNTQVTAFYTNLTAGGFSIFFKNPSSAGVNNGIDPVTNALDVSFQVIGY